MASQPTSQHRPSVLLLTAIVGGATACLAGAAWATLAPTHKVSQKGRMFLPAALTVQRGQVVQVVNDDVDLQHHAYVEADGFNFDSKEMEPGAKADIAFTQRGTFQVLCGIHPKMKLTVRVD